MQRVKLTHLQRLEAESIDIMREVVAEFENPVMLYSIGKDSSVMLHLARKAFHPAPPPFPLLHVDTTWKFREMYEFRERMQREHGFELHRAHQPGRPAPQASTRSTHGSDVHTDVMKTEALKQALDKLRLRRGVRRRAPRRGEVAREGADLLASATAQHQWDPKNQRPELWRLYNARQRTRRVDARLPALELDRARRLALHLPRADPDRAALLRAGAARSSMRDGTLIMVDDDRMPLEPGEEPELKQVRFRTLGCYPLTGAIESDRDDAAGDHPGDAARADVRAAGARHRLRRRRPRWRRRSARGTSDAASTSSPRTSSPTSTRTSTRASCASSRAAASTTARARSSAGCCTSRSCCYEDQLAA